MIVYPHDSVRCRSLATLAWLGAFAWFVVTTIASWGHTPVGVLSWLVPAYFLTRLTVRWWARAGAPLPPVTDARLRVFWRVAGLTCVAVTALSWYALRVSAASTVDVDRFNAYYFGTMAVCGVFPVGLTWWAIWRTLGRPLLAT